MDAFKLATSSPLHSIHTLYTETTITLMPKNSQQAGNGPGESFSYDFADFEKRLQESRQELDKKISQSVLYKEPQTDEPMVKVDIPDATHVAAKKQPANTPAESGLLASLALEAKESLDARQTIDRDKHARTRRVHDALDRILKFFIPFTLHVNNVEPAINRIYRLDARTVFDKLKWQGAVVDSRKQNLSDSAHLSYVVFSVNLLAPGPLMIKRPWDQFDALKKELHHLRLRTLDDLEEIHKRPQQVWLQARLDPALPVQITFQGDYENGRINVLARNLQDFGRATFRLESEDITSALMDELGLFLIGRSVKPPELLCASGH